MSTNYVADEEALRAAGITGINFALPMSSELWNGWHTRSLTAASSLRQLLESPWKKCPLP